MCRPGLQSEFNQQNKLVQCCKPRDSLSSHCQTHTVKTKRAKPPESPAQGSAWNPLPSTLYLPLFVYLKFSLQYLDSLSKDCARSVAGFRALMVGQFTPPAIARVKENLRVCRIVYSLCKGWLLEGKCIEKYLYSFNNRFMFFIVSHRDSSCGLFWAYCSSFGLLPWSHHDTVALKILSGNFTRAEEQTCKIS